ncbi:phthiocerol/phthiodiolone dimycocerosyl transferase family protein [Nocardia jejuensis]|uniref:phthiocerol/phthiodiolone dimycocerosyl transferase family protein n=1 Tax=Nocardia jejuensis TaxID=328049 RepID=UPI0008315691|nr:hypothetical protein [Nocardia jejuensis]
MTSRTDRTAAVALPHTGEVRRPLSPVERWYWVCDQVSPLNVVARVRVRGELAPELLAAAAAALAAEHPLLRVSVESAVDGTEPRFTAPAHPAIPIRIVLAEAGSPAAVAADGAGTASSGGGEVDDSAWQREVETVELSSSLPWRTGPLLRFVDIVHHGGTSGEQHDLLLTISHVIADGTTALTLLRRVLELADRLRDPATTAADIITPRPALPAPEHLLPKRFRGLRGIVNAAGAAIADQAAAALARAGRLAPEVVVPAADRRTRLLHRELTAEQLEAVVERCRTEGVTVHAALAAAMAQALGQECAPGRAGRIGIGSPIDFRAELDPPVDQADAGAYVATVPSALSYGAVPSIWHSARELNRGLSRRKLLQQHLALLVTLRFLCPGSVAGAERSFAVVDAKGPGNVCLSNIGRYRFADRLGDWTLSGAQFIAGVSVSGYFVATVNTTHGALHWNFTYIQDVVSTARAVRLADASLAILLAESAPRTEAQQSSTHGKG